LFFLYAFLQISFCLLYCCDRNKPEEVAENEFWANVFSGSVSEGDDPREPISDLLYPIVDRTDRIQLINNDTISQNVVAVLSASFYWRDVLKNVLPAGKQGLIIVIDNPCTASFTYQIE
jgi:hypothetical protein